MRRRQRRRRECDVVEHVNMTLARVLAVRVARVMLTVHGAPATTSVPANKMQMNVSHARGGE